MCLLIGMDPKPHTNPGHSLGVFMGDELAIEAAQEGGEGVDAAVHSLCVAGWGVWGTVDAKLWAMNSQTTQRRHAGGLVPHPMSHARY